MKQYKDTNYYITENGEVYSKKWSNRNPNSELRKMKPHIDSKGYINISLYINGKNKTYRIHRLVAEYYLPNPNNYPQVNHIDGNKNNNHFSNLEWCDNSHNQKHAYQIGLQKRGEENNKSVLTEDQVKWIRDNHIPRNLQFSQRALARKFNVSQGCIKGILSYKNWKHI
jgi:hypothetical protein